MLQTQHTAKNQYSPLVENLLIKRGHDKDNLEDFFSWDLKSIPDLYQLIDLEKSAKRIINAINNNEKIGIYGDYDVDGTTSCALLYHFFQMLNINVDLCQPSRFIEGYGIHPSSIEDAIAKNIKVLITVDCGISNVETAEYAKERDIDLIITDHHKDAREKMPDAYAIVNPNRRDEPQDSPLTKLAGVGVAFCLCLKIKEILEDENKQVPSIYPLLQYVAIGTICDLAHLNNLNLRLTRHGLRQIKNTDYPGINVFFNDQDRSAPFISSEKISFYVGPLINSKGRLDHPEKALNLLTSSDHKQAYAFYNDLETCNRERKEIQHEVFQEAKEQVLKNIKNDNNLINIVYAPHWHEGVIGIVASKLVETFQIPAIVLTGTEDKNTIKGSCRSAGELDLFKALDQCKDLFTKFGGHKAAAGLSMPLENLPAFKIQMDEYLSLIPEVERTTQDTYDTEIEFHQINKNLLKQLEMMEPFGMGNPRPVFRMKDCIIESYTLLKDVHVKWFITHKDNPNRKITGISFNYIGKWNCMHPKQIMERQTTDPLTLQFQIGINRFRGNEIIQLMVDKVFF